MLQLHRGRGRPPTYPGQQTVAIKLRVPDRFHCGLVREARRWGLDQSKAFRRWLSAQCRQQRTIGEAIGYANARAEYEFRCTETEHPPIRIPNQPALIKARLARLLPAAEFDERGIGEYWVQSISIRWQGQWVTMKNPIPHPPPVAGLDLSDPDSWPMIVDHDFTTGKTIWGWRDGRRAN